MQRERSWRSFCVYLSSVFSVGRTSKKKKKKETLVSKNKIKKPFNSSVFFFFRYFFRLHCLFPRHVGRRQSSQREVRVRGPIGGGQQEAGETGGNAGGVLLGDGGQGRKDEGEEEEEEEEASRDRERGK